LIKFGNAVETQNHPSLHLLPYHEVLPKRSFLPNQLRCSLLLPVRASVPQGSVLGPSLYTADLPQAILSTKETHHTVSDNLQSHLDSLHSWCKHWNIKLNQSKSVQVTFTLRRATCPSVFINQISISIANTTKYLGLYFDRRLKWNPHTILKRQDVNRRYKLILRLLDNR
jgi:hypothetical protein